MKSRNLLMKVVSVIMAVMLVPASLGISVFAATGATSTGYAYNSNSSYNYNKTVAEYTDYGQIAVTARQYAVPGIYNGTTGGTNITPGASGTLKTNYVVQGVTYTGSYYLITAYDASSEKNPTVIYVLNSAGTYKVTCPIYCSTSGKIGSYSAGQKFTGHAGGIASDSQYVYIPTDLNIYCIPMSEITDAVSSGSDCVKVYFDRAVTMTKSLTGVTTASWNASTKPAFSACSFASSYGGLLWVGEFSCASTTENYPVRNESYLFGIDMSNPASPVVRKRMTVPNNTQGVAFHKDSATGNIYLACSTSYGRTNSSKLVVYNIKKSEWGSSDTADATGTQASASLSKFVHKNDRINEFIFPNMSEDLCTASIGGVDYLMGVYESASYKYHGAESSVSTFVMDRLSCVKFEDVSVAQYGAGNSNYDVKVHVYATNGVNTHEGCIKIKTKHFNAQAYQTDSQEEKVIPIDAWSGDGAQIDYIWEDVGFPISVTTGDGKDGTHNFQISNIWPASGNVDYTMTVYVREAGTSNEWAKVATSPNYSHSNGLGSWGYINDTFDIPTSAYPYAANVRFSPKAATSGTDSGYYAVQIPKSTASPNTVSATFTSIPVDQYNVPIVRASSIGSQTTPVVTGCTFGSKTSTKYKNSLVFTANQNANNPVNDETLTSFTSQFTFNGKTAKGVMNIKVKNAPDYESPGVVEPSAENSEIGGLSGQWLNGSTVIECLPLNSSHKLGVTTGATYKLRIRNNSTRTATISRVVSENSTAWASGKDNRVTFSTSSSLNSTTASFTIASGKTKDIYVHDPSGGSTYTTNYQTRTHVYYTLDGFYNKETEKLQELEAYFNVSAKMYGGKDASTDVVTNYYDDGNFTQKKVQFKTSLHFTHTDSSKFWMSAMSAYTSTSSEDGKDDQISKTAKTTFTIKYDVSNSPKWQDFKTKMTVENKYHDADNKYDSVFMSLDAKNDNMISISQGSGTFAISKSTTAPASSSMQTLSTTAKQYLPNIALTADSRKDGSTAAADNTTVLYWYGNLPKLPAGSTATSIDFTILNTDLSSNGSGKADNSAYRSYVITCIPIDKSALRATLNKVSNDATQAAFSKGYMSCYYNPTQWSAYMTANGAAAEKLGTGNTSQADVDTATTNLSTAQTNLSKNRAMYSAYISHRNYDGDTTAAYESENRLYAIPLGASADVRAVDYYYSLDNDETNYPGLTRKYSSKQTITSYAASGTNLTTARHLGTLTSPHRTINYWWIDLNEMGEIAADANEPTNPLSNNGTDINGTNLEWQQYTTTTFNTYKSRWNSLHSMYNSYSTSTSSPTTQSTVNNYINNYNTAKDALKETISGEQYGKVNEFHGEYTDVISKPNYYCSEVVEDYYKSDYDTSVVVLSKTVADLNTLAYDDETVNKCIVDAKYFEPDDFKHIYKFVTDAAPTDGVDGQFHYICEQCNSTTSNVDGVENINENDKYKDTVVPFYNVNTLTQNTGTLLNHIIPAPKANNIVANSLLSDNGQILQSQKIDYSTRGAQVRIPSVGTLIEKYSAEYGQYKINVGNSYYYDEYGAIDAGILTRNGSQALRFRASMNLPAGAEVKETGFVYSLDTYVNGGRNSNTTVGGSVSNIDGFTYQQGMESTTKMYKQVCSNRTMREGITDNSGNTVDAYTFNLVINVKPKNWNNCYSARAYVVYTYGGVEFTVYDSKYSSRSVQYIMYNQMKDTKASGYARNFAKHLCNEQGWTIAGYDESGNAIE